MGEFVGILDVGMPLAVVLDVGMFECLGDPLFDVGQAHHHRRLRGERIVRKAQALSLPCLPAAMWYQMVSNMPWK